MLFFSARAVRGALVKIFGIEALITLADLFTHLVVGLDYSVNLQHVKTLRFTHSFQEAHLNFLQGNYQTQTSDSFKKHIVYDKLFCLYFQGRITKIK